MFYFIGKIDSSKLLFINIGNLKSKKIPDIYNTGYKREIIVAVAFIYDLEFCFCCGLFNDDKNVRSFYSCTIFILIYMFIYVITLYLF